MAFEKGNKLSNGRPIGSLNKKTIATESLNKLHEIGISPIEVSNELINSLFKNNDLSTENKIKLLHVTGSLWKYETLSEMEKESILLKKEELQIRREELKKDQKIIIQESNKDVIAESPQELLKKLKQEK